MRRDKGIHGVGANPQDLLRRVRNQNPELADQMAQLALPWYTIRNQSTEDDTTEIMVYDTIGSWFGVDAGEFMRELSDITTSKINVRINSPGGDVFDSIAIHNALMMHPAKVTVHVDSLAASGASVVAMAGDEIIMLPGSQMMIHDALMYTVGNQAELRDDSDFVGAQSENIAGFYAAKGGGTPDEWRVRMRAETWLFAEEAVNIGLADKVYAKPLPPGDDDEIVDTAGNKVSLKAKMSFRHPLMNRGYNYAGRSAAPAPEDVLKVMAPVTKPINEMSNEEFSRYLADQMFGSE